MPDPVDRETEYPWGAAMPSGVRRRYVWGVGGPVAIATGYVYAHEAEARDWPARLMRVQTRGTLER
jgi:hypothetical protein